MQAHQFEHGLHGRADMDQADRRMLFRQATMDAQERTHAGAIDEFDMREIDGHVADIGAPDHGEFFAQFPGRGGIEPGGADFQFQIVALEMRCQRRTHEWIYNLVLSEFKGVYFKLNATALCP